MDKHEDIMNFDVGQDEIRKYHLGLLKDEARMRGIEQKQLVDDKFDEMLSVAEDDLIEEYLEGNLSGDEEERFRIFFLSTQKRREKVRLTANLRQYAARAQRKKAASRSSIFSFLTSPIPVAAFASLVLIAILGWMFLGQPSETARVTLHLNKALAFGRPFEARVSDLNYARHGDTRGPDKSQTQERESELEAADGILKGSPRGTAESLKNWGRIRLLEGKIDEAIIELEGAKELAPNTAEIWSDLGVAYLQKGQSAAEYLPKARQAFEKALELNPFSATARFNLSLALEQMNDTDEARKSWEEYLKLDSSSQWAEEAKGKLESLTK
jgi:tetratricopeptide (TPR) repeat protein